ncbi:hypothetical protein RI845_03800 [Thalassotalea nanhaiensis]|uniref:DUF7661 domain-containing protein n=1 Tax=Thalassotalea nanhaiensis TaxID=3065648 RepID=A0ABY9TKN5_9GAMM|nr:hypothetical protein RI845_03800 [Colwelliaceae bacterium SQ345]
MAYPTKLTFDVFGKKMSVHRINNEWLLFTESDVGMRVRVYDVIIPADMESAKLAIYLDDIYHEFSSENHPKVLLLNG